MHATTIVGRFALEDACVFADEVMEVDGSVTNRFHKVFGFDPRKQVYTLHLFDSEGANPPTRAEGGWDGETLTLNQETPFGLLRYVYSFSGDEYRHRTEVSDDGEQWSTFIEGRYRRLRDQA